MSLDLIEVVEKLGSPRIMVIGDLMLDRYIWGNAERISQEAPVVLLKADQREERLGGAGSVSSMLKGLDARVVTVGVVGEDGAGVAIKNALTDLGIDQSGVLIDSNRPTTVKERYIGRAQQRHPQQMIRVDYESCQPISKELERNILNFIGQQIRSIDAILISDYDKGVCTHHVMQYLIALAKEHRCSVLVDPIRSVDYRKYYGVTAITPNRLEASLASGVDIKSYDDAQRAAVVLMEQLNLDVAVITLDKDGMVYAFRNGTVGVAPTRPRQVYDITGAGDMVLSVLGLCVAAGIDFVKAIHLANVAGGLEVERIGVSILSKHDLIDDIQTSQGNRASNQVKKIVSLQDLLPIIRSNRANGKRIVFTNGCFDVLHAGHVRYLEEAKSQGDLLVVAVNSDMSVRTLKGPTRPINSIHSRCTVLAALQSVDYVVVFDELTPLSLIQSIQPDVLIKGKDYQHKQIVGADVVKSYGGRVYLAEFHDGFSTTNLLDRIRAA